jgi:hypothetical protein
MKLTLIIAGFVALATAQFGASKGSPAKGSSPKASTPKGSAGSAATSSAMEWFVSSKVIPGLSEY